MSERGASKLQRIVLGVLVAVAVVSSLTATLLGSQKWDEFLLNLGTEMAGAAVTYILLEMVIGTRIRKADLIAQMGSDVRDVAVPALNELRRHGWVTDGSLRGAELGEASLQRADLQRADLRDAFLEQASLREANLTGADLQRANLVRADLQGAILWGANLQGAFLMQANLQKAFLRGANLQGVLIAANLEGASLVGADLRGASLVAAQGISQLVEADDLYGAKANCRTQWPYDFSPSEAGIEMVED